MSRVDDWIEDMAERVEIALRAWRQGNPDIGDRLFNELAARVFTQLADDAECKIIDIDEADCE